MSQESRRSIRSRLLISQVFATALVLGLAIGAFIMNDKRSFRAELMQSLDAQAQSIGINTRGALAFEDADSAANTLKALTVYPYVRQGGLHRADGSILATYLKDSLQASEPPPLKIGFQTTGDSLYLLRPIRFDGERTGYVSLHADLAIEKARMTGFLTVALAIFLASILAAFLLAFRVQRSIMAPLEQITRLARDVARKGNYARRLMVTRNDEVGQLMGSVNEMLDAMQERERLLEVRVADQTDALIHDHQFMHSVLDGVGVILIALDHGDGKVKTVNEKFYDYVDRVADETDPHEVLGALQLDSTLIDRILDQQVFNGETAEVEIDTKPYIFEVSHYALDLDQEYLIEITDITDRKSAEVALAVGKTRVEVTLNSLVDAVITADQDGRINYLNPVAEEILGLESDYVLGLQASQILKTYHMNTENELEDPVSFFLRQGQEHPINNRIMYTGQPSKRLVTELTTAAMNDNDGQRIGVVLVIRDVTEIRELIAQISHQASHDALTGLLNRREFQRRLEFALSTAVSDESEHALLYLDLDKFKVVNDTCGHAAGDQLLCQLTKIMKEGVRTGDTVSRLGGDEFGILMLNCGSKKAYAIAEKLRDCISAFRFTWEKETFQIGASIGLVEITADNANRESALSLADAACYAAKEGGRNRIYVYDMEDQAFADKFGQVVWANKISRALEENRFFLVAQRIQPIDTSTGELAHYEVLLRMQDEDGSTVPPGVFLTAAENYGLMEDIDRWVINAVLSWCDENAEKLERIGKFAINLSGNSISDTKFKRHLLRVISESSVDPHKLCFEFTETAAISDFESARQFIEALRKPGCSFSLDDFGTGMSSFAYLKNFPVDYLKIDGVFVRNIAESRIDAAMVKSITEVGHALGMKTIAEFVENEDCLRVLEGIGVDYGQGYGIHKPTGIDEIDF